MVAPTRLAWHPVHGAPERDHGRLAHWIERRDRGWFHPERWGPQDVALHPIRDYYSDKVARRGASQRELDEWDRARDRARFGDDSQWCPELERWADRYEAWLRDTSQEEPEL